MARWPALLALALIAAAPAPAARFAATVLRVKDGDSLVVERVRERRVSEIRLWAIDAPELDQPWGIEARTGLRRLVGGRRVEVEAVDRDRWGRVVARMWQGRTYVNAAMTWHGDAWALRHRGADPAILAGERAARTARRGLWSLPPDRRIPPATWRQRHPRGG
ncbi:MAG: thermonuclease family protein [Sphingomonadaceae bacterium]|uniref:thermonuclease family protein n=1 Tax=Thermaurantiacus sp. TaxID=2820283 RepID=UPI00298EDA32|nr:thermonuclease family protein [Thermaurantiacus sp.]MCS6986398.1 thermonuclease family protein [Sphingomonadaceae bacterium]MDW8414341.1 thermonuclease family protein [Thermaurantiacus sp.]